MSTPGPPITNFQPRSTNQSLEYEWQPPVSDGGSAIQGYRIQLNSDPYIEVPAEFRYIKVSGLTNGTTYNTTIEASNANGYGTVAYFRPFQPGSVLPNVPASISVNILDSTSALIGWTAPTETTPLDAPIQWYAIYAVPNDNSITLSYTADGSQRQYYIKNLSIGAYNYRYSVYAVNCPGWSPAITSQVFPPNYGTNSILGFARNLSGSITTNVAPTSGGSLTIDSVNLGNYDYSVKTSNTTISSFLASDYFTVTEDSRSAWIIIKGDLTINSGQTFIPSVRKLFTVIYVTGNLICNGTISMTARGANHSGTGNSGGAVTASQIKIAVGTLSGITNPVVPAAGGGGGVSGYNGVAGSAGTGGGTGGGGGGCNGSASAGYGSAGTSFTGGTGGGSGQSIAGNGVANGGAGGNAQASGSAPDECAGAGNPGGTNNGDAGRGGIAGTGGVLIVICEGAISGSGSIQADGVRNQPIVNTNLGGGSTGGGSLTILHKNGCTITPTAAGGTSYMGGYARSGGAGGAGTARALAIGTN